MSGPFGESTSSSGRFVLMALAAATMALALLAAPVAPADAAIPSSAAPAPCGPSLSLSPTADGGSRTNLYAVAGVSGTDLWAVGSRYDGTEDRTHAERWDGGAWRTAATPDPGTSQYLRGLAAAASDNVWAVGYWTTTSGANRTLVERWDGLAWSLVESPNVGSIDYLSAVTVVGPDDAWAVGHFLHSTGFYRTLALHWDGTAWTVVATPNVGNGDSALSGVAAVSSNDVWAVGYWNTGGGGTTSTLVEHWDGTTWSVVSAPSPGTFTSSLGAVAALSPTDAWAVGSDYDGTQNVTLAEHWDGEAWEVVPTPSVAASGNVLNGVAASSGGDVWAVGYHYPSGDPAYQTLVEHWDGTAWTIVSSPNAPHDNYNYLESVAALPSGQIWTVGNTLTGALGQRLCEIQVRDEGFAPRKTGVPQGGTAAWSVPQADGAAHSVTDASGMGLFDSGLRAPGSSFTFSFIGAGAYAVVDSATGHTGAVSVPMAVLPRTGGTTTVFTVTWSSAGSPAGFVFDVQVRRPGSAEWTDWRVGQSMASAPFVPDAGPGTYAFRGRLRNASNGAAAGWSPAGSIAVV